MALSPTRCSRALPQSNQQFRNVASMLTLVCFQVFLLLVTEMLIFCALIVPLPFTWRRKLFTFISESPIIAKLQYGMKVQNIPLVVRRPSDLHPDYFHLHPDSVR
jgi:hypothetical protein